MMSDRVIINDVGPRDGLQNQPKILAASERLEIVRALLRAGVDHVQVGAFVSPASVPAMAGAAQIVEGLKNEAAEFSVLIPNLKGYELALAAGAQTMEMVLYGTDGMANANVRMSRQQAEEVTRTILDRSKRDGVSIITTISVAFECPFEGPVDPTIISDMTQRFLDQGAELLVIADTIGAAHPMQVHSMMSTLVSRHGADALACHFHDTRAMGLANVYAAVDAGIRRFDTSIAGVGGCPFAPGASGNVATEDVVMMVEQMGYDTGIDQTRLLEASDLVAQLTGNAPGGRARGWLDRQLMRST
jgi:hydroxymethylglutaryl-CoA lyase